NCWLHGEFLLMDSEKVSKSKGGSVNTLQSLIDAGYDPLAYRYFCMQAHYRSRLNFSLDALDAATTGLRRIYSLSPESDTLARGREDWMEARQEVLDAINLDLGIPTAVGLLNGYGSFSLWREFDPILGLKLDERKHQSAETLPPEAQRIREQRAAARAAKDWKLSDGLRDELIAMGYEVLDSADGDIVRRKLI
ncbi:MAG: cysteine--tRNA ligase, partial [Armatimonadetes bacterium]|nr:cysteine--tRNA ligase [Armatimonadota bacterium]